MSKRMNWIAALGLSVGLSLASPVLGQSGAGNQGAGGTGAGSGAGSQSGGGGQSGTGDQSGSQTQSGGGAQAAGGSQSGGGGQRGGSGQGTGSGSGSQQGAGGTSGQGSSAGRQESMHGAGGSSSQPNANQAIAMDLLLGNHEEVALAQFVQNRLESDEAKQFATMMIRDHQQAIEQLRRIEPGLAQISMSRQGGRESGSGASSEASQPSAITQSLGGSTGEEGRRAGDANGQGRSSDAADQGRGGAGGQSGASGRQGGAASAQGQGSGGAGGEQHSSSAAAGASAGSGSMGEVAQFQQQVAQRCLALTQQELSELKGTELDMAYLGQQLVAHTQMLAKLQASEQLASGELRQFATQAVQTVEHHRTMAKEIKMGLKGRESGGARTGPTAEAAGGARR